MNTIKFRDREIPAEGKREFAIGEVTEIEEGVIEFSLTSEEPYERWYGVETLRHTKDSVVLNRVDNGSAPLLENHDPDKFIGTIQKAWVDESAKKLRVRAKFELDNPYDTRGNKIYHRVKNGSLKTVSGGYRYLDFEEKEIDRSFHLVATKWELIEGSFTPTPADFTVGVGRKIEKPTDWENLKKKVQTVEEKINNFISEVKDMPEENQGMTLEVTREEDINKERQRSEALFAAGHQYNCPELASRALKEGWSIEQLRSQILQNQQSQQPVARTNHQPLGMNEAEKKRYSFIDAINCAREKRPTGFVKEIHEELVKKQKESNNNYKETGNILIPVYDLNVSRASVQQGIGELSRTAALRNYIQSIYKRDQMVGDPLLGGNLVETELLEERFIDIFRNRSMMRQMGMQSLTGLVGYVDIPKQTGGAIDGNSVYWVPEDADVGLNTVQFGLVKFRPKNVGAYMYVTRSMLLHSSIGMDNFIRRELAIALALGIDKAAIDGTGTNDEPLGILNTAGVNPILFGADGGPPTWEKIVQFETKIATANADERTMGWLLNAKTRGELKSRQKFAGTTGETLWQFANNASNQGYVNGYRAGVTNQIRGDYTKGAGTNLSGIVFGDFSRLICGEWGSYELAADPYDRFLAGGVRVRIIHTCDIQVTQEKAFSVATDLATPFSEGI